MNLMRNCQPVAQRKVAVPVSFWLSPLQLKCGEEHTATPEVVMVSSISPAERLQGKEPNGWPVSSTLHVLQYESHIPCMTKNI